MREALITSLSLKNLGMMVEISLSSSIVPNIFTGDVEFTDGSKFNLGWVCASLSNALGGRGWCVALQDVGNRNMKQSNFLGLASCVLKSFIVSCRQAEKEAWSIVAARRPSQHKLNVKGPGSDVNQLDSAPAPSKLMMHAWRTWKETPRRHVWLEAHSKKKFTMTRINKL